jgi:hypothetical protein
MEQNGLFRKGIKRRRVNVPGPERWPDLLVGQLFRRSKALDIALYALDALADGDLETLFVSNVRCGFLDPEASDPEGAQVVVRMKIIPA